MPHTQTPGPWTLETVKTSVGVCHKIGPFPGRHRVGYACVYEDGMALWRVMGRMDSELLSNARLMAAAPDLLDACNGLLGLIELLAGRNDLPIEVRDAMRDNHRVLDAIDAVKKAEGR